MIRKIEGGFRWKNCRPGNSSYRYIIWLRHLRGMQEKLRSFWLSLIGRTIVLNRNIYIRNLFSSCLVVHKIGKLFCFAERWNAAPASLSAGMFPSGCFGRHVLFVADGSGCIRLSCCPVVPGAASLSAALWLCPLGTGWKRGGGVSADRSAEAGLRAWSMLWEKPAFWLPCRFRFVLTRNCCISTCVFSSQLYGHEAMYCMIFMSLVTILA